MKKLKAVKIALYNFFDTSIGKAILNFLSRFVYVSNLKRADKKKNREFIVVLTIDTESGFVDKKERRVWQIEDPSNFIGYTKGIENWTKLLNKYKIKSTYFLSTQCFDAKKELKTINKQLKDLDKEGNEIALHLHPDSDFALQKYMKNNFRFSSAKFFDYKTILSMLSSQKDLIEKNLGKDIKDKVIGFRWGGWGLNTSGVKALNDSGFLIDSSAVPGIKGHVRDYRYYNWSKIKTRYPWKLSITNYTNVKDQNSNVLEIPIATFNFFGLTIRADPVYSSLLMKAFKYYHKFADRSEKPFIFVVNTHSSEGTYEDGKPTRVIRLMERFIVEAKKYSDIEFLTLKESYKRYTKISNVK